MSRRSASTWRDRQRRRPATGSDYCRTPQPTHPFDVATYDLRPSNPENVASTASFREWARDRPQLALVFDDGYAEEYHEYRSFVEERGVPFSLAITPGFLGDDGHLTVEQLRELTEAGCGILAHGRRHRHLQGHRLAAPAESGERRTLVGLGFDPAGFVFPCDAVDPRAWQRGRLARVEITTSLDALVDTGGLGVLADHSSFEAVTPERVSFVVTAAAEQGTVAASAPD